jgi:ABC-2 type transport system ATP-binding protein
MRIITGFIPASYGNVTVNDIEVGTDNPEIRKKIGYLPENNPLYPEMYIREYLGFVSGIYNMPKPRKKAVDTIIEITGLGTEQNKKIGALSKGYRQRVGLAQALIHNPEILILDEATSGLDPNQIVEIRNLILQAGREKTVLLSTHIMQEVEAICDRVIIIDKGIIVANEEKANIYSTINRTNQVVLVEFDKDVDAADLAAIEKVTTVKSLNNKHWIMETEEKEDIRPYIFAFAVSKNLMVLSMQKQESNLEEVFRHLTNG